MDVSRYAAPTLSAAPMRPTFEPAALAGPALPLSPRGADDNGVVRGPARAGTAWSVTLDERLGTLAGSGTLSLVNSTPAPIDEVVLRLWYETDELREAGAGTIVRDVRVNGSSARTDVDGSVVRVRVPNIAPGERFDVSMGFTSTLPPDAPYYGRYAVRLGRFPDGSFLMNHAFPTPAVNEAGEWKLNPWVASTESFSTLAGPWHVTLDAPSGMSVAATGEVAAVAGHADRHVITADDARDMTIFATRTFTPIETRAGDTTLRVWRGPEDAKDAWRHLADMRGAYEHFASQLGDYDGPDLDAIVLEKGGMEYYGMFAVGHRPDPRVSRALMGHELGHMWFRDMVGSDEWQDPWLDEGVNEHIARVFAKDPDIPDRWGPDPSPRYPISASVGELFERRPAGRLRFQHIVYQSAADALDRLRDVVGADDWAAGLRDYVAANRWGVGTPREFVDAMSRAAGRDLTADFARELIHADGSPHRPTRTTGAHPDARFPRR